MMASTTKDGKRKRKQQSREEGRHVAVTSGWDVPERRSMSRPAQGQVPPLPIRHEMCQSTQENWTSRDQPAHRLTSRLHQIRIGPHQQAI